jgi:hypothetical protein
VTPDKSQSIQESRLILRDRRFLTCCECGWVHYVMTSEEKAASDHFLERYQLSETERYLYESAFRQCLRCESPADEFRAANEDDMRRAAGHIVTPIFVGMDIGSN